MKNYTVTTKAERTKEGKGKLSKVIEWEDGSRTEIPIHTNGSVRWFDDEKLRKKKDKTAQV